MPTLSSSNRSQLAYKLEGTYPTNYGVAQGGNGSNIGMLSESLDFTIKTETSKQIRADRQVPDVVQVSASAQGGFAFEQQFREYDPFIETILGTAFTVYGTNGQSAAIPTLTFSPAGASAVTITAGAATTGVDIFTSIQKGQWIRLVPPAGATQAVKDYFAGRAFRVSKTVAPTTTVITLDSATPINTGIGGTSLAAGFVSTSYATNHTGTTPLIRSYTLEVGHSDIGQFRQYLGMIPSKMDLSLSVGSIITGSFEFVGKEMKLLQATSMGTPSAPKGFTPANATKGVFDLFEGGASISATTFIKSASFTIDGSLRTQDAVGVFGVAGVAPGTFVVNGKLEVYFADASIYNKVISGAATSISIPVLDVSGNGYVYDFFLVKYTAAKVNAGGLDQDNMLQMDFTAVLDPDSTAASYQKTIGISRLGLAT